MRFGGGESGGASKVETGAAEAHDPVELSEELIWKARAQEAEEKLGACEARVGELERELEGARESARLSERRGQIERECASARAVDMETAVLLTEAAIGAMDEPDVEAAVRELRARKPFLFGCSGGGSGLSAMSANAGAEDGLGSMARGARASGDRSELLRYLRARRGG